MTHKTIDLDATPLTLDELLAQLAPDVEVTLVRASQSVARITPLPHENGQPMTKGRIFGLTQGTFEMSDDFTDELPDSFWLGDEADRPLNGLGLR